MKQPGKKQQVFSTCTLKELCNEDKQKVAKLVKQVVELGQENQRLKDAADKASSAADEKVKQIQECNKQAVQENCSLKTKLGQAVTVLRMYHHKVQGLDAALRAMQHAAASSPDVSADQSQQDQGDTCPQQLQLPLLAPAAEVIATTCNAGACNLQPQQPTPASVASSPPKHVYVQDIPASAAAARLQQQAQRLSQLLAECEPSARALETGQPPGTGQPFSTPMHSPQGPDQSSGSGGSSGSSTSPVARGGQGALKQQSQAGCYGDGTPNASDGKAASVAEALPVTPLVLPPHCAGVGEALHSLAAWQLQQGLLTQSQAADMVRLKVLQFDPSIGGHGAFVIQEPPSVPPFGSSLHTMTSAAATTTITAAAAAAPRNTLLAGQHQGNLGPLTLKVPDNNTPSCGALSCSSSAVPGLLDASPWESPTCKQLMDLAAAFDNLAVASTPGRGGASALGGSPAGECSVVGRKAATPVSSVATGAADSAVSGSMGVGLPCEYGVEEVPVQSLGAGQLPVLVQNEKSWTSTHTASPAETLAGRQAGPLPMMPGMSVPYDQEKQLQHLQPAWSQQQAASQARHYSSSCLNEQRPNFVNSWQQPHHPPLQHRLVQQQQQQQQQRLTAGVQGFPPAVQQSGSAPWPQQQQPCHTQQIQNVQQHHSQHAQQQPFQQMQLHPSSQGNIAPHVAGSYGIGGGQACTAPQQQCELQQHHLQQQQQWDCMQRQHHEALDQQQWQQPAQELSEYESCSHSIVASQSQHHRHDMFISDAGSGALSIAADDAQQLLQRFDESLVDLLSEIERLEQQQQQMRSKRHRMQQQPEEQQVPQVQHRHEPLLHQLGTCYSQHNVLNAPQRCRPAEGYSAQGHLCYDWQQQSQSAQPHGRLQSSQPPQEQVVCSGWPHNSMVYEPEDDEISEILNS